MQQYRKYILSFLIILGIAAPMYSQAPRFELVHYPDAPLIIPGFQAPYDSLGVADPELLWDGNAFRIYYTATGTDGELRILAALSRNLMDWQPLGVILEPEPGSFDRNGVSDPDVLQVGDQYHLYYTGRSHGWKQIGRISSDDGIHFSGPRQMVLGPSFSNEHFDYLGVGESSVIYQDGHYFMMFRGFDNSAWWRLGLAISTDGIRFSRILNPSEFGANFGRGPHGFDDGGAGEPEIWTDNHGNDVRLLYTSNHY